MTSEHPKPARSARRSRWVRFFGPVFTWSTLLGVSGIGAASGTVACAEETFQCCACKFSNCMAPDAANPGSMIPAPVDSCDCKQEYTYESCGVFCYETLPAQLKAKEAAGQLSGCGAPDAKGVYTITPSQNSVLAKNSCEPGSPVGPE